MTTYNLSPVQAAHFATRPDKAVLVVALPKQPPKGYDFGKIEDGLVLFEKWGSMGILSWSTKLPHPKDSVVGLREPWGWYTILGITKPIYKADYYGAIERLFEARELEEPDWRSPATMPSSAIRHHYRVTGVRVCRVGDVTYDEWVATGIISEPPEYTIEAVFDLGHAVRNWFNARHTRHVHPVTWPEARVAVTQIEREG